MSEQVAYNIVLEKVRQFLPIMCFPSAREVIPSSEGSETEHELLTAAHLTQSWTSCASG